jgi:polyferredoxin
VIVSVFVFALATRTTLRVDVIRDRGVLGREVAGGMIENVYRLQIINASEKELELSLHAVGLPGLSLTVADQPALRAHTGAPTDPAQALLAQTASHLVIPPASNRMVPVVVRVPADAGTPGSHHIHFVTTSMTPDGQVDTEVREASSFIFPN